MLEFFRFKTSQCLCLLCSHLTKFKEKKNTSSRFGEKRKTLKIKSQTLNARENFTSEKTFELQIVLTMEEASRESKVRERAS